MKILIVTGGETGERKVSILSAENISQSIDSSYLKEIIFLPEQDTLFRENIVDYDLVIPVIHGKGGEDGYVQKICEENDIPYLFSTSKAHLKAFNKDLCKDLVQDLVNVPKTYTKDELIFPAIYKKIDAGSSLDISIVENTETLNDIDIKKDFIFEQYISGREFTVGVVATENGLQPLPVIEILKSTKIFNKEQKYAKNNSEYEICPADISLELKEELQKISIDIFNRLGLAEIARVDYIVTDDNQIFFLEVNTIPGMTNLSLVTRSIRKAGYTLDELLDNWILKKLQK